MKNKKHNFNFFTVAKPSETVQKAQNAFELKKAKNFNAKLKTTADVSLIFQSANLTFQNKLSHKIVKYLLFLYAFQLLFEPAPVLAATPRKRQLRASTKWQSDDALVLCDATGHCKVTNTREIPKHSMQEGSLSHELNSLDGLIGEKLLSLN